MVTTSYDYLSLSGQAITLGQIDISDDTNLAGGDGLALTGDTLSVNVDDSSIEINSDTLRVKALGISNAMLGGSIANAKLSNSSVSYGGISLSLGGSDATPAFDLSDATSLPIIAGTTGTLTVARGGTGATTASGARTNLNVDVAGTDNSTDVTLVTTSHDYLSISGQAVTLGQVDISDDTNLVGGTGITLTGDTLSTTDSEIVHDDLSGFVSNEHIDHSSVSITAGTGLSGGGDITSTRTLTTDDSAIVHDDLSGFVANEHIDHSGVSITAGAGLTGGGDITATRDIAVGAGTGVTVNADDIAIGQDVGTNADVTFNSVIADNFIGSLDGAVKFEAKATVALNKGDAVYVVGVSGNTPTIALADANDATKMPSFGLVGSSASIDDVVEVVTFGTLKNINTSSFSEGDILFISSNGTAGNTLTATKEGGESVLCQNIGKVIRSHATVGSIKVGGAGRANATPNLNDGNIFIGNGSNQAVSALLNTKIEDYLDGGTSTANFDTISVDGAEITATPAELNVLDGITSTTAELNYTDGVTSNIQTQLDLKAPLASPAFTGTATGANLTLSGDLTVNGSTTTLDTTNLAVEDNLMELNAGVTSNANDSGFLIERGSTGDNAIFMWDESADKFTLGTTTATGTTTGDITLSSTGTLVANVEGGVTGAVTGNADTATTLATARNFSLTGDVTAGAVSFDGSGNVALSTTIAANSVALGTDTTGNYMSDLTEGTGIDISHTPAEGSNGTITLDLTEVGFGGGANRLITDDGDGTVSTEANLTFDGTDLAIASGGKIQVDKVEGQSNNTNALFLDDDQTLASNMVSLQSVNHINIMTDGNNNGTGDFRVYNGSYDTDTADLAFRITSTSIGVFSNDVYIPATKKLYLDGGVDTYIFEESADNVIHYVGGQNKLRFNSTGAIFNDAGLALDFRVEGDTDPNLFFVDGSTDRVGIGTNSPGALLDVAGTGYIRTAVFSDAFKPYSGTLATYGNNSSTDHYFVGDVGIGTNSPTDTLQVEGSIGVGVGRDAQLTSVNNGLAIRNLVSNADMFFYVNDGGVDTEAMRIDGATGNVGIGTQSPGYKLQVSGGDIGIDVGERLYFGGGNHTYISEDVDDRLRFFVGGDEFMRFTESASNTLNFYQPTNFQGQSVVNMGNVGIGTSSPGANLDVAGSGGTDGAAGSPTLRLSNTVDSTDWDTGDVVGTLEYYAQDPSGNAPYVTSFIKSVNGVDGSNGTLPSGSLTFGVSAYNAVGGAVERMRIESDGNVGIGTTTPQGKFQVRETSTNAAITSVNPAIVINNQGGSYTDGNYYSSIVFAKANSNGGTKGAAIAPVIQNSGNSTELSFSTIVSGGTLTEALRIDKNQNVGIGTTSPDSKLQVEYTTTSNGSAAIAEFGTSGSGAIANSGHQVIIGGPSVGGYTGAMIYSDSTSGVGQISFADGRGANDSWRGTIAYEHANDRMEFWTNATEKIAINSDGDFIPAGDGTQDLGASSKRWGVIYSADLDLSNEGSENDVDGTWGSYVIQEGEEDLFLINRRSGKKYKFMLQEVQD